MDIHPKVAAATGGSGVGGALALILVWALNTYAHANIPDYIAVAIGTVFSGCFAFAAGYLKPAAPCAP